MSETKRNNDQGLKTSRRSEMARKLDAAGWGLFFIWVGIAILMDVGWGAGLLGVSIVTLGGQAVRRYYSLKLEGLSVAIGLLFFLCGIWELFGVKLSLMPILLIVAGVALLASIARGGFKENGPSLCRISEIRKDLS